MQVGVVKGMDFSGKCDEFSSFADTRRAERLGLVSITQQGCSFVVKVQQPFLADIPLYDRNDSDVDGYKFVSLHLSSKPSFRVASIKQDGMHATVDMVATFPFTATGKKLEAERYFPDLNAKDCEYDLPLHGITCRDEVSYAYVDKKWIIDPSKKLR